MTVAIIIIVCCWIISFFFNGIESGLLSIDPVRLRQNVKRRVPAALRLNRLLSYCCSFQQRKNRAVIRVFFHVCLVRVHIFPSRFGQPL